MNIPSTLFGRSFCHLKERRPSRLSCLQKTTTISRIPVGLLLFPGTGRDIRGISRPVPPTNPRDSELAANGVAVSYTLKMPEIIIRNRFTKLHLYGVFFVGCTRISKAWLTLNNPRPIFSHHTDRKIQPLRKSRLAHVHAHSPKGTYCRFHLTRITVKAWSGTVFKTAA